MYRCIYVIIHGSCDTCNALHWIMQAKFMTYSYACLSGSRNSQFQYRPLLQHELHRRCIVIARTWSCIKSINGLTITTIHEASAEVRRSKSNALGNRQYQRRSCVASTQERFDSLLLLVPQLLHSFLDSRANI